MTSQYDTPQVRPVPARTSFCSSLLCFFYPSPCPCRPGSKAAAARRLHMHTTSQFVLQQLNPPSVPLCRAPAGQAAKKQQQAPQQIGSRRAPGRTPPAACWQHQSAVMASCLLLAAGTSRCTYLMQPAGLMCRATLATGIRCQGWRSERGHTHCTAVPTTGEPEWVVFVSVMCLFCVVCFGGNANVCAVDLAWPSGSMQQSAFEHCMFDSPQSLPPYKSL